MAYTQATTQRHNRVGYLFRGRFKGILVDKDAYLLELSRYVVLNPVRAGIVDLPEQWPWSSYRAMMGKVPVPKWLAVDGLLCQFGAVREEARHSFQRFVLERMGQCIWDRLRQQIYLGDETFVERIQAKVQIGGDELTAPQPQRRPPTPSLADIDARHSDRNAAIVASYATGAYSYREIAAYFGVHLGMVERIVRKAMQ